MHLEQSVVNDTFNAMKQTIIKGKQISPLKIMFYGENGAGKSKTLSFAKSPIMLDMEGNSDHIEIEKAPVTSFTKFDNWIDYLIASEHEYKSLIIDSVDSLQMFISTEINSKYSKNDLAYGKESAIWAKYIKEIIDKLEYLRVKKGMNIFMTAQRKTKTENNPMTEPYDRYDVKINEQMRAFCNWCQAICLLTKNVILDSKDASFGKKKAKNVEHRVLYTHGTPAYFGKNVFDLPETIFIEKGEKGWEHFLSHIKNYYGI